VLLFFGKWVEIGFDNNNGSIPVQRIQTGVSTRAEDVTLVSLEAYIEFNVLYWIEIRHLLKQGRANTPQSWIPDAMMASRMQQVGCRRGSTHRVSGLLLLMT